ncbi:MAG: DNA cytosine methyltransferase [bacterium]|nr:DNA cytosine methyltransferase [bacterium]
MNKPRAIDLFCGAGGSSWGARNAGVDIVAGFDMWPVSQAVYSDNFNTSKFYTGKLETQDPEKIARQLGHIDLIIASPECTNHSLAKGSKPVCDISRNTAFQVIKFAKVLNPRWLVIENVATMKKWPRYNEFLKQVEELGYNTEAQVLNSADFGVPQNRKRLFIQCDKIEKPDKIQASTKQPVPASTIINHNGKYSYTPLRTERRAKATLERAERAITALGKNRSFLIVYYGSDYAGGWQSLDKPLRTITTIDRFAIVRPNGNDYEMRMLQPEELKVAMSMPKNFKIEQGTRRNKIKMIGNAVCPEVMKNIVSSLVFKE